MKRLLIVALLTLAVFAAFPEEEDVLVLSEANFDEAVSTYPHILVEFYAPWCGHCKKLAPEYSKAAATLKASANPVPLAKVDATENNALAEKFGVEGFPTLKFISQGETIDYNGGRTANDIVSWVAKRSGAASKELKTVAEFDAFLKGNKVVVVFFGSDISVFAKTALSFDSVEFGHVISEEVTQHANGKAGTISLFKQFDENRNDFSGDVSSVDAIKDFINANGFATVMEFDDAAIERVFQQGNPTIFLFQTASDESTAAREQFNAAAQRSKGKVIFSVSRPDDGHGHFQRLADYVGANTEKAPCMMLIDPTQEMKKFQYSGDISADKIVAFVDEFKAGTLAVFRKSEEIPEKNDEPVKVIVGKSWDDMVINNTKDVLVKFYAPWCGHCKSLAPKWEAAAQRLSHNPNIVIAKMDATLNEVDGVQIQGFPTLKFFAGNDKQNPVDYDGDRTDEAIIEWLKKHTTHEWVDAKDDL